MLRLVHVSALKKIDHALHYKKELDSRKAIFNWFQSVGIMGIPNEFVQTSHAIDSCAAALAAWHWGDRQNNPLGIGKKKQTNIHLNSVVKNMKD